MWRPPETTHPHTGRYAPSPTGPLHKGSLVAALASFLQARAHGAAWKMRIDDLDAPRVLPGAASHILRTLEQFGLHWDGPVIYQSRRGSAYAAAIKRLWARRCVFDCGCTRQEARTGPMGEEGPIYPGTCRNGIPQGRSPRSLRAMVDDAEIGFTDRIQGFCRQNLARDIGDFVVRRADGLVAYQLATVVDDAAQQVGEVVRGADLLSSTPRQMLLQMALGQNTPAYAHVPLLLDSDGRKLGKSNGALALDARNRGRELTDALTLLGQKPVPGLEGESIDRIVVWAVVNWRLPVVPRQPCITVGQVTTGGDPIVRDWPNGGG